MQGELSHNVSYKSKNSFATRSARMVTRRSMVIRFARAFGIYSLYEE